MAKKNTAQLRLFEQTMYEYFVLLSPSDTIKQDVDSMKQALHDQIGLEAFNLNSVAHLSLYKTEAPDDSSVVRFIKKVAGLHHPFTISLNGYDILKHGNVSRTICLKVTDPKPINRLMASLNPPVESKRTYRQTSILDKPKKAKPVIHPHVTIARKIPIQDFNRINEFSLFDYQGEWLCDNITILRRPAGSTGHFSPCRVIPLG
jgi:2'-5' RNA ligase